MYYDELYHHGIKGQRWGVRRFQNKDGSLTKLGQKRVDKAQRKATKSERGGFLVKKKTPTVERATTDEPVNPNDLNARFRQMTGDNTKSAGRGRVSELAGLAGIAGIAGSAAALYKLNNNKVDKPEAFGGKKPERPKTPEDVLTNDEARKKWLTERSVYEKELKDFNSDKGEYDNKMSKYNDKLNARLNLTKSALDATKGASTGIVNMMEKSNERKAEQKAASLDLSHYSEKELRDYVSRYQAEEAFRNVAKKQYNSGRSKTMEYIETAGALAGVGASILGFYTAYKQATRK
jgi:hypothetical protein